LAEPPEMVGFTEKLLDRGRQQHDALTERMFKQGSAISTWLVVGNAGALLLTGKALLEGSACPPQALQFIALCFALSLLLTVAGMMVGFLSSTIVLGKLSTLLDELQGAWIARAHIDSLEREGVPVPEGAALKISEARHEAGMQRAYTSTKRLALVGTSVAYALMLLGCVSFGTGVLRPLVTPGALDQCTGATRALAPSV